MISEISSFGYACTLAKIFFSPCRHDAYQGLIPLGPGLATPLQWPMGPNTSRKNIKPLSISPLKLKQQMPWLRQITLLALWSRIVLSPSTAIPSTKTSGRVMSSYYKSHYEIYTIAPLVFLERRSVLA